MFHAVGKSFLPFMDGVMQDRLRAIGSSASNALLGSHGLMVLGGIVTYCHSSPIT